MKHRIFLFTLLSPLIAWGQTTLTSPDGHYRIAVTDMSYSVTFHGDTIIRPSLLGIDIDNRLFESALGVPRGQNDDWSADLVLRGEERSTVDTLWSPLYGERRTIRDHYNQLVLHYEKGNREGTLSDGYDKRKFYAMDIVVRAYNEGVALRYHFPETSNGLFLHLTGERTTFALPACTQGWYEEWAQGPYDKRPLCQPWYDCERPLLLQLPDGKFVALLEGDMRNHARGKFRLLEDNVLQVSLYGDVDIISPHDTPWRVIMAAEQPVELINHNHLLLSLAPPSEGDYSWVRTGKAFRSTRLDRANILRSIDLCQSMGLQYVELDAGWYGPEGRVESDARRVAPERDFSIPEICRYAQERGVGVWLYVNQRALARQLDELLPLYEQWGVSGVKFGFVHVGSQQWTTWLHEAVLKCARHHLMVDIHDEYRPTGLSRTLPNLLTQEGVRGNEEMPDAHHNTLLPFTRFLCGPADYTPCYFDKRIRNTHAHQLALAAVYYSPLQFLFWYDRPDTFRPEPELDFWRRIPTTFDESVALDGWPGEFVVQARRSGQVWFVGVLNGLDGRNLQVSTDFLPRGRYRVTLYEDNPESTTSETHVSVRQIQVRSGRSIPLSLQPSGGAALIIEPVR